MTGTIRRRATGPAAFGLVLAAIWVVAVAGQGPTATSVTALIARIEAPQVPDRQGFDALDGDVNTVLTSWRVPASDLTREQPVTPRALLSHTSGADDGFGFPGHEPAAPRPTIVQVLEGQSPSNVGKVLFARAPFRGYKYSGGGIAIMQLALTELTGRPFAEFMQSTVREAW